MANPSDQGTPRPAGPAVEPFKTGTATPSSTASHPMPSTAPMSSASSPTGSAPERSPAQPFESGRQPRNSGPSIATGLKETAQTATDAVRQQAAQFAQDVGHELNKTGEAQKARGVEAIRRFARAIDNAASELQSQSPVVARSVHEAARRVDGLSDNLANRNVSEFVNSATQLTRSQPALFIGGSVAVGFALARFLKSSARHGRSRTNSSPYEAGAYRSRYESGESSGGEAYSGS